MTERMRQWGQRLWRLAVVNKLLESKAGMTVYEVFVSVYPYFMGAMLLGLFAERRWLLFYLNLASAATIAVFSVLLHRTRREHLALNAELLKTLDAEREKMGKFLKCLIRAAGPTGKGKVMVEIEAHAGLDLDRWSGISIFGAGNTKPEARPEKMN